MLIRGILPLILFSLVIFLFINSYRKLFRTDKSQIIDKRVEELQEKKKKLDELKQAVLIQEKINLCEQEIEKLNQQYQELLRKNQK